MKNLDSFFEQLLGGRGVEPPPLCTEALATNFPEASLIEWSVANGHYEATFYQQNREHIAIFSGQGQLLEYRVILPEGYLPHLVKVQLEERGEIMNRVLINKGNTISYEVIYRDAALNRYLVLVSETGEIFSEKQL